MPKSSATPPAPPCTRPRSQRTVRPSLRRNVRQPHGPLSLLQSVLLKWYPLLAPPAPRRRQARMTHEPSRSMHPSGKVSRPKWRVRGQCGAPPSGTLPSNAQTHSSRLHGKRSAKRRLSLARARALFLSVTARAAPGVFQLVDVKLVAGARIEEEIVSLLQSWSACARHRTPQSHCSPPGAHARPLAPHHF